MSTPNKYPETQGVAGIAASVTSIVEAFSSLVKLLLIGVILVVAWSNRAAVGPYIAHWLDTTTHVGFYGLSWDRQVSAERTIAEIAQRTDADPKWPRLNVPYARGAIIRASRNAEAIVGARILWVDGNPQNNDLEASILSDIGIEVRRALSTGEALSLLPGFAPDLIISNIVRDGDAQLPLNNCPAHYFEVPSGASISLKKLNEDTMAGTGKATGFGMAEAISQKFPDYTKHAQPRLIFYSGANGGVVAAQCARLVTNRVDVLLQGVVSALEEFRWQQLKDSTQPLRP